MSSAARWSARPPEAMPPATPIAEPRGIVAVTGGRGMVGRVLVRHLLAAGYGVRVLSRSAHPAAPGTEAAILPPPDAPDAAFHAALSGARHVVHAAGIADAGPRPDETALISANCRLAERVADAARAATPGRFLYLSSIRAVAGRGFEGVLDETRAPSPADPYGRSKLAGEEAVARAFSGEQAGRLTVLRPAPVYGPGLKGNLRALLRLADTPLPLPFAGLRNRRSLLCADSLAEAVLHLLAHAGPLAPAYVVADVRPLALPAILAAFRAGLGRPRRQFPVPPGLLAVALGLAGRSELWHGLSAEEVCSPAALAATGWTPEADTPARLAELARSERSAAPL